MNNCLPNLLASKVKQFGLFTYKLNKLKRLGKIGDKIRPNGLEKDQNQRKRNRIITPLSNLESPAKEAPSQYLSLTRFQL